MKLFTKTLCDQLAKINPKEQDWIDLEQVIVKF